MTLNDFRSLCRGNLVKVEGNGNAVIEAAYYQGGSYKVDLTTQSGLTIAGLDENNFFMLHHLRGTNEQAVQDHTSREVDVLQA